MCGIIGYIGEKEAKPILLDGLKRLEYRGYDSAGISVLDTSSGRVYLRKEIGRVKGLEEKLKNEKIAGRLGLGHTRWATHGGVTDFNAHPHFDCKKEFFVVHNDIIENYKELRERLVQKGHQFVSQTDTEVIPHLLEEFSGLPLESALRQALNMVKGAYALAVFSKKEPQKLVGAKFSSPLIIALWQGEKFLASDASAVLGYADKVVYLEDGEIAVLTPDDFYVSNQANQSVEKSPQLLDWDLKMAERGGYPHFMLKEIFEQPEALSNTLAGRLNLKENAVKFGGLEALNDKLRKMEKVVIVACGTAYYAGLIGKYLIEEYAGIPAEAVIGSEFRYRRNFSDDKTLAIFISQSGETADTLASLAEAKRKGALTVGIVNVVGSSIARAVDAGIYNHIGPEIAVASTKAFTSQLAILIMLAVYLGRERKMSFAAGGELLKELSRLPGMLAQVLEGATAVKKLAEKYVRYDDFLFIGRKYNYPIALEAALKLKEVSYIHAEGYAAGEMKHGPIALLSENFPIVGIAPQDSVYEKTISNLEEAKARRAPVITIVTTGNKDIRDLTEDVIYIPKTIEPLNPILAVAPLQLFAYYVSVLRGIDVDKPRNLAKSVTVE